MQSNSSRNSQEAKAKVSYTPGPWWVEPFDADRESLGTTEEWFSTIYAKTEKGNDFILADMCGTKAGSYAAGTGVANAHLIAAAPEMLEALEPVANRIKEARDTWHRWDMDEGSKLGVYLSRPKMEAILSAIRKAKGGQ